MSTAPSPSTIAVEDKRNLARTYVWDVVVRLTHWTIALSILVLSVTGVYLGHPYLSVPDGPAGEYFTMGTVRAVHFYTAIFFTVAVLSRILWMVISPSKWAKWHQFLPVHRYRWDEMWGTLKFYLLIRRLPPPIVGHNPLAGAAYAGVFGLYLVMIASGLGLYGMQAHVDSWMTMFEPLLALFGGAQTARWIHHMVMWLLLGFFVHHFYSALLVSIVEKNGTLDSIFSGYKWVEEKEEE